MRTQNIIRGLTLSAVLVATLQAGATGASESRDDQTRVISQSNQLSMTEADFRRHLTGAEKKSLAYLSSGQEALRDRILDFHSNLELARQAESLGLDKEPAIANALDVARREILVSALMRQVSDAAKISDADAKALAKERYALTKEKLWTPERRRVAHILLTKSRTDCACDPVPPLGERIEKLKEELASGADFAHKAKELSQDPGSARNGGELPDWVEKDQSLVAPFEEALFALESPGEISEPIGTQYGYHFIKLLEIEKPRQLTFKEVESELTKQVKQSVLVSALEKKRAEAYPDPRTIKLGVAKQVLNEVRGAEAGAIVLNPKPQESVKKNK